MTFEVLIQMVALLVSPFLAIFLNTRLEQAKERSARRHKLFHTLMATRGVGILGMTSPEHVAALNMIGIEFIGVDAKARAVVAAWREYLGVLNTPAPATPAVWEGWYARRDELFVTLLYTMSSTLGYGFERAFIRDTQYAPIGHAETEIDGYNLRKRLLELIQGNRALHVTGDPVIAPETVAAPAPPLPPPQSPPADTNNPF
jgi:hypothetical protein